MYAIVEIAGKQYKVQENDTLYVSRLTAAPDDTVTFDRVLLMAGDDYQVGTPTVSGATVTAKVLGHVKGDKVIVFKKKRRKRYKVKNGHRQPYTQVEIQSLSANGKSKKKQQKQAAPKETPTSEQAPAETATETANTEKTAAETKA